MFPNRYFVNCCTLPRTAIFVIILPFLCFSTVEAQDFTVEGTVYSTEDEATLPGVTVVEEGTQRGTITDPEGRFTLDVSGPDAVLQFSFVGFLTKNVEVDGRSEIEVSLDPEIVGLEDVVVTAIGLERDRRSIGYSISQVQTDDLVQGTEANLANLLQGQISGVNVAPVGGSTGASTRVTIRGASSLTGDNQPLYVVDGIPIDNTNLGAAGMFGGFDGGDGIQSLNPSDIESMSVLKGASAAALYGERARDGVILITTRQGEAGTVNVNFSHGTTFDRVRVNQDYQTTYGQGVDGRRPQSQSGAHETNLSSWGEPFDGQPTVQWDGVERPYSDLGSVMSDFYRTGISTRNDLSVSGGVENATYYFSASHLNDQSIVDRSDQERTSLTVRGTATAGRFDFDLKANYIDEGTNNRQRVSDAPSNVNTVVNRLPRNVPLSSLEETFMQEDGSEFQVTSTSPFIQNPYWVLSEITNWDDRDRLIGHAKVDFEISDWLLLTGRSGLDWYTLRRQDVTGWGTAHNQSGALIENEWRIREANTDVFLSGIYDITPFITIDAVLGGALRNSRSEQIGVSGSDFTVPGLNTISNMESTTPLYNFSEKEIRSIYGTMDIGYNDYLFLNFTARNDWSSTLPADSNSFFYPSVSTSFIFSDAFDVPEWMSHGQVRASWAEVGSDTNPYQLDLTYSIASDTPLGQPRAAIGTGTIPLADLKPTITSETELGFDVRFFDDRLGLDFAWYDRSTTNQILSTDVSGASGFGSRMINAGQLDNTGIELQLTTVPVLSDEFIWRSSMNYGRNKSEVVELVEGQEILNIEQSRRETAWITAQVGEEFGTIRGFAYERDQDGNIVHENGLPVQGDLTELGRGTPDWTLGWSNRFSYREFALNVHIDAEWGGQLFSGSNALLYGNGLHQNTLEGRSACDDNRRGDGRWAADCFVGTGVDVDGGTNETGVMPNSYYGAIATQIAEEFVYDRNLITMRQIQLSYNLPVEWAAGLGLNRATFSVVGRNLFFIYNPIPNIDPESNINRGNAQGLESESVPLTRSIGFNIDLQF